MAEREALAEPGENGAVDFPDGQETLKSDQKSMNKAGVGTASSPSSESDEGLTRKPTFIRQMKSRSRWGQKKQENSDDKLYVVGSLDCALLKSDSKTEEEFAEEGIYQGLVMTNKEREELGILPEAIYMTTKLMQKKDLIESMLLSTAAAPTGQVQEVPSKTPSFKGKDKHQSAPKKSLTPPEISKKTGTSSSTGSGSQSPKSTSQGHFPRYREFILRPPPLPPLTSKANRAERRAYSVVDNLVKSEAAYLTSLNIAIQVYLVPLRELAHSSSAILSVQEVESLFGPIEKILKFQEMFYTAIIARTLDWTAETKIGDVLSSLNNKDVINNYSTYINSFTSAMTTLGNAINKKPKFVHFYKEKYESSRTSLSLQGLLLKPIQRFPQYIMFLQDLIKYTHCSHPDRVTLQLALARYESITNFLNEHKRQREQLIVVQNLTHRVSHLPFKLTDSKRWLHRQDIVTRIMVVNEQVVFKERCLLLFSNMILCAAMKRRKKKGAEKRKEELESTTGSRDFETTGNYLYSCKWYCPLDKLEVIEPDYLNDIWDKSQKTNKSEEYLKLKEDYKKLEQDFLQISRIATMAASLHAEYQGLSVGDIATHGRILQRKLAKLKGEMKLGQHGRLDIRLPTRDGDKKVTHTYSFRSDDVKDTWVNTLRYSKHKLNHPVATSWVIAEDTCDDIFEVSYKLPLFVETYNLNFINNEVLSVQCGVKVGKSCAWLASGDNSSAQISIVECVTPAPLILECFKVNSKRILDIIFVPPSSYATESTAKKTFSFKSRQSQHGKRSSKSFTLLPPYLGTVWMGGQCGRLSIFLAESSGEDSKQCLAKITLNDSITSLQYYQDQVFAMTADGEVAIFKRLMSGFNLSAYKTVQLLEGVDQVIRCTCKVGNKLWVAVGGGCLILNMQTHEVEGTVPMTSGDYVVVNNMVFQGEGVWVSYKGNSSLELFHTSSKQSLQSIDVQTALRSIVKRRKLEHRVSLPSTIYVTSILASHGYLWIGTNTGCILVYHIPYLDTVPIISGKPYLAMDSHTSSVRVLLPIHTSGTVESSRLKQFEDDESHRRTEHMKLDETEEADEDFPDGEDVEPIGRIRSSSVPPDILQSWRQKKSLPDANAKDSLALSGDAKESPKDAPEDKVENGAPQNEVKRSSTFAAVDLKSPKKKKLCTKEISSEFLPPAEEEEEKDKVAKPGREGGIKEESDEVNRKEFSGVGSDDQPDGGQDPSDDDYNSDELMNKERFRNGIRPLPAERGVADHEGSLESRKLRSFAVLAQHKQQSPGGKTSQDLEAIRDSAVSSMPVYGNVSIGTREIQDDPYSDPESDSATIGSVGGVEDPYDNPTELCMLDTAKRGTGPYDDPAELGMPSLATGSSGSGPYDDPAELGMPSLTTRSTGSGPYDDPTELGMPSLATRSTGSGPYDDPAELGMPSLATGSGPYDDPAELGMPSLATGSTGSGPYDDPAELGMPSLATGSTGSGPYDDPTELGMPSETTGSTRAKRPHQGHTNLSIPTRSMDMEWSGPYDNPIELSMVCGENGAVDEKGPYDDPTELGTLRPTNGTVGENSYDNSYDNSSELGTFRRVNGEDRDEPYNDPTELGTMKKLSTLELIKKSKADTERLGMATMTSLYNFPGELEGAGRSGHPYEDPATLAKGTTSTPSSLFSTKDINSSLFIPQRNPQDTKGAVFVLTAGRGLRNLRSGRRVSVFNQANKEAEACMMVYEIEL